MPAPAIASRADVSFTGVDVASACLESASLCEDKLIEQFVKALLPADEAEKVMCGQYTETLHATLLNRIERLRSAAAAAEPGTVKPLAKWRLRRVQQFVDANIEHRLSLDLLARTAGLSRMYFAAQFRAATGSSPHDYVIKRRIGRAKQMLIASEHSLVDIALSAGFQTQSHFTTVFKRSENITPHRWRELHVAVSTGA